MNCYYHNDEPAIGVCKSCMRGICIACGSEVNKGIACSGRCEEDAEKLNEFLEIELPSKEEVRNSRLLESSVGPYSSGIFSSLLGVVFLYYGITESINLIAILGALQIGAGAWSLYRVLVSKMKKADV